MSGGPVVDDQGWVVGVLAKGMAGGTSYLALAYPALAAQFEGGWPDPGEGVTRTLLTMSKMVPVDRTTGVSCRELSRWR